MADNNEKNDQQKLAPEHGSTRHFEGNEERRERIEKRVRNGEEGQLSQEDYQFAIQHGIIEG